MLDGKIAKGCLVLLTRCPFTEALANTLNVTLRNNLDLTFEQILKFYQVKKVNVCLN